VWGGGGGGGGGEVEGSYKAIFMEQQELQHFGVPQSRSRTKWRTIKDSIMKSIWCFNLPILT